MNGSLSPYVSLWWTSHYLGVPHITSLVTGKIGSDMPVTCTCNSNGMYKYKFFIHGNVNHASVLLWNVHFTKSKVIKHWPFNVFHVNHKANPFMKGVEPLLPNSTSAKHISKLTPDQLTYLLIQFPIFFLLHKVANIYSSQKHLFSTYADSLSLVCLVLWHNFP